MKEKSVTVKDLQDFAYRQGQSYETLFEQWLDYVIDIFDAKRFRDMTFEQNIIEQSQSNELYFGLMMTWLDDNTRAQEQGKIIDWFGEQYEEQIKSKSKADALGQFYTPISICNLMADISSHDLKNPERITADDCACGSGRTLLALEQSIRSKYGYSNRRYYSASDIDHMSVRMCALNLMIAGVCGQVLCRDSLSMETWYGYEINEVRTPILNPMYSIRKITPEEAAYITRERIRRMEHDQRREKDDERPTEADPNEEEVTEHIAVKTDESGQVSLDFDNL